MKEYQNYCFAGEDIAKGQIVLQKGENNHSRHDWASGELGNHADKGAGKNPLISSLK
ncbi:hypothetical protein [Clostridium sp. AF32-12BH]|uniref:hypothetical protein n=1 Tax=Clostridium sp. AF32-12BH TaxID=2292006 RepID=UPI0018A064B8|nr:hypothetical protein [Clostridium sp. AF32-12BH]